MSNSTLDSKSLKILYYQYKDTKIYGLLVLSVILLIGFILIWWIVIPEVQKYISIQDEVNALQKKVTLLKSNLNYIQSSDPTEVDDGFQSAIAALPADKDFEGLLYAISASALRSGIALDDFSFSIGKLATESGTALTAIPITLSMKTDVPTAAQFIDELNQKVPLSDISVANVTEDQSQNSSSIQLNFYYQPLGNVVFHDDAPIPQISDYQKQLLQKMKEWKDVTDGISQEASFISSASAGL